MNLELKAKAAQAEAARTLSRSFELVQHHSTTYIPADWQTEDVEPLPPPDRRIWLPLTRKDKLLLANRKSNILFASDGELASFDYMLRQFADEDFTRPQDIFVRTPEGLRVLSENGVLEEPDGVFRPNFLRPMLNQDKDAKGGGLQGHRRVAGL